MVRDREFTWAFVGTEEDQPVLKIDEAQYVAVFRQEKATVKGASPVLVTILRTLRTTTVEPVEEITLTFRGV